MEERRRPTADDAATKKNQEDDDLESLRLKLIQAEKENIELKEKAERSQLMQMELKKKTKHSALCPPEELRNRIMEQQQVKQSNVINQDGPEDMKTVQLSDAMFQDLRNRILELVKQTYLINQAGFDDTKAVQISDAIFQRVRNSIIERVKQSNGMTRRQLSDAMIQELGRMSDKARRIIGQNDYLKEEFSSTADSAFNILPGVPGDEIVGAETSAANPPPAAIPPTGETNEASELAPGGHPADNNGGINLEGELEQGAVFSPHREPISSPPIQFHGDPSFLSEALLPIQFHGHHPPAPFLSEALLPIQFHGDPSFLNEAALPPIQFHGHPPQFLNEAQFHHPPQFLNAELLPPIQFHHHPPQFLNEALPPIQFHHHPPPFLNEELALPPDFRWAEIGEDDYESSDLTGFD